MDAAFPCGGLIHGPTRYRLVDVKGSFRSLSYKRELLSSINRCHLEVLRILEMALISFGWLFLQNILVSEEFTRIYYASPFHSSGEIVVVVVVETWALEFTTIINKFSNCWKFDRCRRVLKYISHKGLKLIPGHLFTAGSYKR